MCYEVNYVFLRTAVEWYPFGPCRITYKMMLNSMHCHHRVGLEISAKALLPLSQIPPECARSYCMPFHTSRSTLSCNIWKQINKHINKNNVVIDSCKDISDVQILVCRFKWTTLEWYTLLWHDDVIEWKYFPRYWTFVREIHRSPLNSLTKVSDSELWCFLWSAPEQTVE